MGKKSQSRSSANAENESEGNALTSHSPAFKFLVGNATVDSVLASLFENSAGPVRAPTTLASSNSKSAVKTLTVQDIKARKDDGDGSENEDQSTSDVEAMVEAGDSNIDGEATPELEESKTEIQGRKRKRNGTNDNLEDVYMRRLAEEEEKEVEKRRRESAKRRKTAGVESGKQLNDDTDDTSSNSDSDEDTDTPKHESLTGQVEADDLEKSNRTVFLGNVSTQAITSKWARKTLLKHLASFFSDLPEAPGPHKVESIRFRSTPFASGGGIPKRASFAKKEILDETTPSTNAYVVYSTVQAARKAPIALNGTVVLDRHLRVDSVAHPAAIDHKRCVFVGNLAFVNQETSPDNEEKKKKPSGSADVEEGLWRTFTTHTGNSAGSQTSGRGIVESVRVVRDRSTRVSKGFAYVQFYNQNCVEEALLLDGKKFPPMLPRKLRVIRAKKTKKRPEGTDSGAQKQALGVGSAQKTLQGRASRLFGRAGAAQLQMGNRSSDKVLMFEGQRASENGAHIKLKTKSRGSQGKPKNRSSKRAAAFKAASGKFKSAN